MKRSSIQLIIDGSLDFFGVPSSTLNGFQFVHVEKDFGRAGISQLVLAGKWRDDGFQLSRAISEQF
jgi:hypothetical protein